MSEVREVTEYHEAYGATFAGRLEQLETDAARMGAPHILAQADQFRAALDETRDTSLRTMGVIP